MPGNYEAQKRWSAENMLRVSVAFTNKSGIPEALRKMEEATGEKRLDYIRRAVKEQLEFDGWLNQE